MNNCIFATAGHIDHGKTALIKMLTGTDTDRLVEEKKRGITIDLGYAYLRDDKTTVHFIDVPGHEKFVRNMLAGTGTVNAVLMIIAADESIKPQTIEHYEICKLLGIKHGVIAVTKKDLVDGIMLEVTMQDIKDFTEGGFLENAKILPVSSRNGEGMEELRREILRLAAGFVAPAEGDIFRLPVDRSFTVQGFGTVVTGSLIQGKIRIGDSVEAFPSRKKFSIRGIQVFNNTVNIAVQGQRTALNLHKASKADLKRGDILTNTDYFFDSKEIEARIELLEDYEKVVGRDRNVKFYHLSQERNARLFVLGSAKPKKGAQGFYRIIFDEPVFTLPGDRFIIRRLSPVETIGGGLVVFNKSGKRTALEIAAQAEKLECDRKEAVYNLIKERGSRCISLRDLRSSSGINTVDLNSITTELRTDGRIIQITPSFLYADTFAADELKERCILMIAQFHKANPRKPGLSATEITEMLGDRLEPQLADYILSSAVAEKKLMPNKQYYALPDFKHDFEARKSDLEANLEQIIKSAGLTSPTIEEISQQVSLPQGIIRQALKNMADSGSLTLIAPDIFIQSENLKIAIENLKTEFLGKKEISVQNFKNLFGISRKYLIPILEYFDRSRITTRLADGNRIFK
jgi:selenocysteine-specific elongation factor